MKEYLKNKYRAWILSEAVRLNLLEAVVDGSDGILADCCKIAKKYYYKNIQTWHHLTIGTILKWNYGSYETKEMLKHTENAIFSVLGKRQAGENWMSELCDGIPLKDKTSPELSAQDKAGWLEIETNKEK